MTTQLDHSKDEQIINAIASKIMSIPNNVPCDYGTLHRTLGNTKRQAEAIMMGRWACKQLYKWSDSNVGDNSTDEDRAYRAHADQLAAAAIEKVGE